jgi:CHAT domain-containing protein
LIEEYTIGTAVDGQLLLSILSRPPSGARSLLLVGDVDYGKGDQGMEVPYARLNGTKKDIDQIQVVWRGEPFTRLTGSAATKTAVVREMLRYHYIHFGTHGVFHPDLGVFPHVSASVVRGAGDGKAVIPLISA